VKIALGLIAVLPLSGCGSNSSTPAAVTSHNTPPSKSSGPSHSAVQAAACRRGLRPLMAAETQLNSGLDVAVQFSDYTSRLGNISVAYNRAVSKLKSDPVSFRTCSVEVGLPLQRAFNDYRAAGNTWNHCITDYSCSFDHGSPAQRKAQAKWQAASVALDDAKTNLASMGPR
jgi:hypothetical protein